MASVRLLWYRFCYFFARCAATPFVRFKINYTYDKVHAKHRPYLALSNHTTLWDYLLVGVPFRRQMYYVAGEHLFRNKILRTVVMNCAGLIIRKKGAPADDMIAEMKQVLKSGANVWMSPEGARSINGESAFISPATGKLVKECAELGAGLITYRIHGGYLRRPRWGKHQRKGKMWGEFVAEYSPEELMSKSVDEINEIINRDMYVNTFDDQKKNPTPYKGEALAENLETTLWRLVWNQRFLSVRNAKRLENFTAKTTSYPANADTKSDSLNTDSSKPQVMMNLSSTTSQPGTTGKETTSRKDFLSSSNIRQTNQSNSTTTRF